MTPAWAFVYGCIGGALLSFVRLLELAQIPKIQRPPTFTDWVWVVQFFGTPIIGGILVFVYANDEGIQLKPVLAMNIGISAPIIIKAMAAVVPRRADPVD